MRVLLIEFRTSTPYPVQLANAVSEYCDLTLMLPKESKYIDAVNTDRVKLELFDLPSIKSPRNLKMVWHVFHRIKSLQPDLVHISFWSIWTAVAMRIFYRSRWVATVHDVEPHPGEYYWWNSIPAPLYSWQWRWADRVIVHSTEGKTKIVRKYDHGSSCVHVIPIGTYNYYQPDKDSVPVQEESNNILYFGRIWGYKGLEYFIKAEPMVANEVENVKFVIAGQGEAFEKYQEMIVHPNNYEIYNYHIPNQKVTELFQRASLVVLPYLEASQSGVIPVAYAFGKPVIATTVGGIPDVVDNGITGILVPPANSKELADAIVSLLKDDKKRIEMGKNAYRKGEEELSWQNIALKTIQVYADTLNHEQLDKGE